jgi:hypothetical protein
VTLWPSRLRESEPFVAVTLPSLARLLLEDVVNLSYEEMLVPLTEMVSDVDELPVFTATMTTSPTEVDPGASVRPIPTQGWLYAIALPLLAWSSFRIRLLWAGSKAANRTTARPWP